MLEDAFEVRKAANSVGFAGERPVPRRPHAGPSSWRSDLDHGFLNSSSGGAGTVYAKLREEEALKVAHATFLSILDLI